MSEERNLRPANEMEELRAKNIRDDKQHIKECKFVCIDSEKPTAINNQRKSANHQKHCTLIWKKSTV